MAKVKEDKFACVVCGTTAKHMIRDQAFNLCGVCFDHCACHGDGAFAKEHSWEVWVGKTKPVPQKHMDMATKEQFGVDRPSVTKITHAEEVAPPPKRKGGRPRKVQPTA